MRDGDERLTVEVTEGDPPTVSLTGEVDPHTAPQLESALDTLIDGGATAVRIDAAGLAFIDSSGLRVLVDAHRRLGGEAQVLVLSQVSPTFRRLLEVTGLDEHVTVESTTE
jgi:anti-sigma B factor antagonist